MIVVILGGENFSSELFIDRRGVRLIINMGFFSPLFDYSKAAVLEQLYRASLYKIECVYNRIKKLPAPVYEHSQRLTKTYTEKVRNLLL